MSDEYLVILYDPETNRYQVRGYGKEYKDLYTYLNKSKSYKCIWDDFPWDCFTLSDEERDEILNKYDKYTSEIRDTYPVAVIINV